MLQEPMNLLSILFSHLFYLVFYVLVQTKADMPVEVVYHF